MLIILLNFSHIFSFDPIADVTIPTANLLESHSNQGLGDTLIFWGILLWYFTLLLLLMKIYVVVEINLILLYFNVSNIQI